MPATTVRIGDTIVSSHYTNKNILLDSPVGVSIGTGGTDLKLVKVGSVSIDPPSIAAGAAANVDVSVSGLQTTDIVFVECAADLEAGLIPLAAYVPAANTLRVRLFNSTAAAIDGAARTWNYLVFRV